MIAGVLLSAPTISKPCCRPNFCLLLDAERQKNPCKWICDFNAGNEDTLHILLDELAAALYLVADAAAIVREKNNPLDDLDVGSLPALGTLRYFEADFLPFFE